MKNTSLKQLCFIVILSSLFIISCEKNNLNQETSISNIETILPIELNEARNILAQGLSEMLKEIESRKFLKQILEKKNDENKQLLLYELIRLKRNNVAIKKSLLDNISFKARQKYGESILENIIELYPAISISMPETENYNLANWDVNQTVNIYSVHKNKDEIDTEYIIFRDGQKQNLEQRSNDIDENLLTIKDAEYVYIVDKNGKSHDQKTKIQDFMPIIPEKFNKKSNYWNDLCISSNLMELKSGRFYILYHNEILEAFYDKNVFIQNEKTLENRNLLGCERDNYTQDMQLYSFRILNWGVYQNIRNQLFESNFVFHGDVSMVTRNSFGTISPLSLKMVTPVFSKSQLLDCSGVCYGKWQIMAFRLWSRWVEDQVASPVRVDWAEVDNGTTTVSFSFPLGVKFKIDSVEVSAGFTFGVSRVGAAIVTLGSGITFYCDPIAMAHNTGSVEYRIR